MRATARKECEMRVSDLMTTNVVTVGPEATLKEVASLLAEHGISGVPVTEGDRVVGVISEQDFLFKERPSVGLRRGVLARLIDETDLMIKIDARIARDAMSAPPVTIASGRSVADAAKLMLDEGVSRLPVVDSGRLVGIITEGDLVRAFARTDDEIRREIREETFLKNFAVRDLVDVQVRDGLVTITGPVATKEQAELVEAMVEEIPGVVSVDAHLNWRDR
jgi:CBS domain-containing protein